MLNNGELFESQEREGEHIRRMRAAPEPEAPQVAVRWLAIYEHTDNKKRFPGNVLYADYGEALRLAYRPCDGTECIGLKTIRIEL